LLQTRRVTFLQPDRVRLALQLGELGAGISEGQTLFIRVVLVRLIEVLARTEKVVIDKTAAPELVSQELLLVLVGVNPMCKAFTDPQGSPLLPGPRIRQPRHAQRYTPRPRRGRQPPGSARPGQSGFAGRPAC